jgi:hypothetical protein
VCMSEVDGLMVHQRMFVIDLEFVFVSCARAVFLLLHVYMRQMHALMFVNRELASVVVYACLSVCHHDC